MERTIPIKESVLEKVVAALNMAIGVTSVYAKECHADIMAAATALDDEINDTSDEE